MTAAPTACGRATAAPAGALRGASGARKASYTRRIFVSANPGTTAISAMLACVCLFAQLCAPVARTHTHTHTHTHTFCSQQSSMWIEAYPAAANPLAAIASAWPWYSASEMHIVVRGSEQLSVGVAMLQRKISQLIQPIGGVAAARPGDDGKRASASPHTHTHCVHTETVASLHGRPRPAQRQSEARGARQSRHDGDSRKKNAFANFLP